MALVGIYPFNCCVSPSLASSPFPSHAFLFMPAYMRKMLFQLISLCEPTQCQIRSKLSYSSNPPQESASSLHRPQASVDAA